MHYIRLFRFAAKNLKTLNFNNFPVTLPEGTDTQNVALAVEGGRGILQPQ